MANVTLSSMATEAAIQYGRLFYIIRLKSHFLLKLEEWIIHNEKLEEDKLPKKFEWELCVSKTNQDILALEGPHMVKTNIFPPKEVARS